MLLKGIRYKSDLRSALRLSESRLTAAQRVEIGAFMLYLFSTSLHLIPTFAQLLYSLFQTGVLEEGASSACWCVEGHVTQVRTTVGEVHMFTCNICIHMIRHLCKF